VRKKRYGRLQKALADISLLAGSPADAQDHYTTAAELCRVSNDWLWTAAALQGLANAKVIFLLLPLMSVCVCISVCLSVCVSVRVSVPVSVLPLSVQVFVSPDSRPRGALVVF